MIVHGETTVKLGPAYGPGRVEMTVETETAFKTKFCSKHPTNDLEYDEDAHDGYHWNASKKAENWYCKNCRELDEKLFQKRIENCGIDCVRNISHSHECRCLLGHNCDTDPCDVRLRLERETAGGEVNEMMVLGAQAPNKEMTSVYNRLTNLESENAKLRELIDGLIDMLPEGTHEALGRPEILLRTES